MKKNLKTRLGLIISLSMITGLTIAAVPFSLVSCFSFGDNGIGLVKAKEIYEIDTTSSNALEEKNPFHFGNTPSLAHCRKLLTLDDKHHFQNQGVEAFVKSLFTNIPENYNFTVLEPEFFDGGISFGIKLSEDQKPANSKKVVIKLLKVTNLDNKIVSFEYDPKRLAPNLGFRNLPKSFEDLSKIFDANQLPLGVETYLINNLLPKLDGGARYIFTPVNNSGNSKSKFEIIRSQDGNSFEILVDVKSSNSSLNTSLLTLRFRDATQNAKKS